MKGLILSGGKGTRLRPLTYTSAKQLVPVANKPVLFYTIENLVEAGISEIGIVVGDTAAEVKTAVGSGEKWNAKITYIQQEAPLGLAHAVKISHEFLGDDQFVMYLGDNMLEQSIRPLVEDFKTGKCNCQILLKEVTNPQSYGVAVLAGDRVVKLVEKPADPPSNLALVGVYMFDHNIFTAVNEIKPSWRGELEITDAIQYLVTNGYNVKPFVVEGWWVDTGKQADMLEVNRLILDRLERNVSCYVDKDSRVEGKVVIEQSAEIINSVVRGPTIIGRGCRIINSYVGPYTSINHNCTISDSEVEHSIILENSQIHDIPSRIEDSLIGRNVVVEKSPIKPKALKLLLGDNSRVGIL
ncbi:MAG: glucose-1-phosphate thymidylyltransferase [Chloroflexi bacterium]|uniref:Glucose-1-phosphate thymidylyltransferase n=1 Tax=Candidatus Chlorohelix allophototropha TaxID=3003348 RepID=A0A8T7LYW3_9CHLR|nr:glucose-1-phosphate thymidylyltransferase [Chloroflexota bacterium]WJW66567.1 glucose-1-phosphate thymidylyltransferase [Chloroflexota bacterium L227-S17]